MWNLLSGKIRLRIPLILFSLFTSILAQSTSVIPRILEHPRDLEIRPGGTAYFTCRYSTPPSRTKVSWFLEGRLLENLSSIGANSGDILGDGTLVLKNVDNLAGGRYSCRIQTEIGAVQSRQARLTVHDRKEKPQITHRPLYTTIVKGDRIVLDCLAIGYPPPTYSWYKDGGRLSPAHDRFNLGLNGSLIIDNAQLDDSAHYRCSASNYLGKASSSARVQVETNEPPSPPKITSRPRSATVEEGGIVEMTCVAEGSPYPDITWWNNNRIVTGNSRVTVSNGGQHLRLQDIEVYDQGDYTCAAENRIGKETVIATITVISDGDNLAQSWRQNNPHYVHNQVNSRTSFSRPSSQGRGLSDTFFQTGYTLSRFRPTTTASPLQPQTLSVESTYEAIYMHDMPHQMEATMGSTVQLPCKAEGNPAPSITWEKDGIIMRGGAGQRFAADGSLLLFNVSTSDSGSYMCIAHNGRERRTASTFFSVINNRVDQTTHRIQNTETFRSFTTQRSVPSFSGHTGILVNERRQDQQTTEPVERNYDTDLSYDVSGSHLGDQFVVVSIQEAQETVDRALNHTVNLLFEHKHHTNRTPYELLNVFRYPSETDRELARAGEIYQRTLELVEAKVKEGGNYNLSTFSTAKLISPANLELIGNISGCEALRREADCEDICFHSKYRSVDGSCNNHIKTLWGASLTPLRRILEPEYENGFNTPIGFNQDKLYNGFKKPNARLISTKLISTKSTTQDPDLTHMVMQWGQFLDHDIDHSMEAVSRETFRTGQTCGATCSFEPPCFPILVPDGDPRISRNSCIEFTRSSPSCGSGTTSVFFENLQKREQINRLTSYIDASQVYGSSFDLATNLRNLTNDFGRLREGLTYDYGKPLLPFNDGHPIDCRRDPRDSNVGCFLAGDVRANEQLGLLSMHTIWFREHNRVVEELRQLNPHWDGDVLYQEARKVVWSYMQHITYSHWLPKIIGPEGMEKLGKYEGYNPKEDASITNVFATSALRFGHTLISPIMKRLDSNFTTIPEGDLPLHKAFFSPWRIVEEGGLDPIIRGLFASPAKMAKANEGLNDILTERLFEVAHTVALDLAALNIQRGRDHGLPSYTRWKEYCGLGSSHTWESIEEYIKDSNKLRILKDIYGHPENIDLFVGSTLEEKVDGGRVGPTTQCLLIEQFKRLRNGDRFWYENPSVLTSAQLAQIKQATLSRIICDNADDIRRVPLNVFMNTDIDKFVGCGQITRMSFNPWTDCAEEEEISVSFSRQRRDTSHKSESSFIKKRRENSEQMKKSFLLKTVRDLEKRIAELEQHCPVTEQKVDSLGQGVCIDFSGQVRMEGETWEYPFNSEENKCVQCSCQVQDIRCELILCKKL